MTKPILRCNILIYQKQLHTNKKIKRKDMAEKTMKDRIFRGDNFKMSGRPWRRSQYHPEDYYRSSYRSSSPGHLPAASPPVRERNMSRPPLPVPVPAPCSRPMSSSPSPSHSPSSYRPKGGLPSKLYECSGVIVCFQVIHDTGRWCCVRYKSGKVEKKLNV